MSNFLSLYEPLDVIGTGSFGVIRKVRRKSDGMIFARKELKFERMSERDKKLIVSEVNILKDLHHEHIVRYHDRCVDREAGIMYILMEYCSGGDLSSIIKQAQRHGRPIPEDTVWNYFMQILLALNYCHHPSVQGRTSGGSDGDGGRERRAQILHRDLKPDNVFQDENNIVKLGDFGLSKALAQASFAQTYVGTPYYMSPELMQEKAYDSKSDIWSLGCLIFELCALKPPFHEAKTHAELSILIRNGRIPPLPKVYSPALSTVIKSMLNLNPAMRPSAAQLLQHERVDLAYKILETQKMLNTVKAHKSAAAIRERELSARETTLAEREAALTALLTAKDTEIASLRSLLAAADSAHQQKLREALLKREEELRQMVMKQEAEMAERVRRREEEVAEAVRRREEDVGRMWAEWEREVREGAGRAVEERMGWVKEQWEEVEKEREQVEEARREVERRIDELEERERRTSKREGQGKTPLEEVKNILAPLSKLSPAPEKTPVRGTKHLPLPDFEFATPISRAHVPSPTSAADYSAMKGVVLTETGEKLATPTPSEFAKFLSETSRASLDFGSVFGWDLDGGDGEGVNSQESDAERVGGEDGADGEVEDDEEEESVVEVSYELGKAGVATVASLPAPRIRRHGSTSREKVHAQAQPVEVDSDTDTGSDADEDDAEITPKQTRTKPVTRLRRLSMLASTMRMPSSSSLSSGTGSSSAPAVSAVAAPSSSAVSSAAVAARPKSRSQARSRPPSRSSVTPMPMPMLAPSSSSAPTAAPAATYAQAHTATHTATHDLPPPTYDFSDEENLPSPFLKKVDRERITRTASAPVHAIRRDRRLSHLQPESQPQPQMQTQSQPASARMGRTRSTAPIVHKKSANLRAVAVVNAAHAVGVSKSAGSLALNAKAGAVDVNGNVNVNVKGGVGMSRTVSANAVGVRSSIAKAQRASEEARKALFRA